MNYKSRGNYSTGLNECRPNCQCFLCRKEKKEKGKQKEQKKQEAKKKKSGV